MNSTSNSPKGSRRTSTRIANLLAVDVAGNGERIRIDLHSIKPESFTSHHGTTVGGTPVQSLQSVSVGKSLILRSGKTGPAIAATDAEMEVFATQFLQGKGFQVHAPQVGNGQGSTGY